MRGFLERLAGRTLAYPGGVGALAKPVIPVSFGPARDAPEPMAAEARPPAALVQSRNVPASQPVSTIPAEGGPAVRSPIEVRESAAAERRVVAEAAVVKHATLPAVPEARAASQELARGAMAASPAIPRMEPRSEPARAAAQRSKAEASEPAAGSVVRISIGRIDVRAEFAPAPAVRVPSRAPAPALTLDAYRRQRDGGLR